MTHKRQQNSKIRSSYALITKAVLVLKLQEGNNGTNKKGHTETIPLCAYIAQKEVI